MLIRSRCDALHAFRQGLRVQVRLDGTEEWLEVSGVSAHEDGGLSVWIVIFGESQMLPVDPCDDLRALEDKP